eukprot:4463823-Prorocentrum_lima.AAC.1
MVALGRSSSQLRYEHVGPLGVHQLPRSKVSAQKEAQRPTRSRPIKALQPTWWQTGPVRTPLWCA